MRRCERQRKVDDLERYLGANLIIRTSRNLQLTDAGSRLCRCGTQDHRRSGEVERRPPANIKRHGDAHHHDADRIWPPYVSADALDFMKRASGGDFEPPCPSTVLFISPTRRSTSPSDLANWPTVRLFAVKAGEFRLLTCASPAYLERHGVPQHPTELTNHDGIMFHNRSFFWSFESTAFCRGDATQPDRGQQLPAVASQPREMEPGSPASSTIRFRRKCPRARSCRSWGTTAVGQADPHRLLASGVDRSQSAYLYRLDAPPASRGLQQLLRCAVTGMKRTPPRTVLSKSGRCGQ